MADLSYDADDGHTPYVVAPLPGVLVSLPDQKIDTKRKTAAEIGATLGHKDVNSLKIKTEPQKVYTTADIGLEKQGEYERDISKKSNCTKSSSCQNQSRLRRYECDHCGRIFPYLSELAKHKTIHSDERPFHCDQCGKSFKRSNALKEHRFTHTKAKPYQCPICGRAFGRVSDVNRHKRVHFRKSLPDLDEPDFHLLKDMLLATDKRRHLFKSVKLSSPCEINGKILNVQQQSSQFNLSHRSLAKDQQSVGSLCVQSTKSCTQSENQPVEHSRVTVTRINKDFKTDVLKKPLHTENKSAGPELMVPYPFMKVEATVQFGTLSDAGKVTDIQGEDAQKDLAIILTVENQFVTGPISVNRDNPDGSGDEFSGGIHLGGLTARGGYSVEQSSGDEPPKVR